MVLLYILLSLSFLLFCALVMSLISRIHTLDLQASRLISLLNQAGEEEKNLSLTQLPSDSLKRSRLQ